MSDDKSQTGQLDRIRVAGSHYYEIRRFAEQNNISISQAEKLMAKHENNGAALNFEGRQIKE